MAQPNNGTAPAEKRVAPALSEPGHTRNLQSKDSLEVTKEESLAGPHLVARDKPEIPCQALGPSRAGRNATSPGSFFGSNKYAQFTYPDIEEKYPRDVFGEDQVWLTYLDEAELYDRNKIDGWNAKLNILLVYIGIFSLIVATFISQMTQRLQQHFTQATVSLMFEIVQLQRANLTGASIADVPSTPNSPHTPPTNASLVIRLWMTSLTISLCTALIAGLAKQWLHYYLSPVSGTPREKVMVKQFRRKGLEKWRVALIIDLLPVFLNFALGVFLGGLMVFIFPWMSRLFRS